MSPRTQDGLDAGLVRACPECDETGLRKLKHNGRGAPTDHDAPWKCTVCLVPVDEPVVRKSRKGRPTRLKLLELDPDDVPGLSGGEGA